jgi:hypothetical protein
MDKDKDKNNNKAKSNLKSNKEQDIRQAFKEFTAEYNKLHRDKAKLEVLEGQDAENLIKEILAKADKGEEKDGQLPFGYRWNTPEQTKYVWSDDMDEISGFGGDYEECCRFMVSGALDLLDTLERVKGDKVTEPRYAGLEGVYGILTADNAAAKLLDEWLTKEVRDYFGERHTPTGAMHHACISAVLWVRAHSWNKFVQDMKDRKQKEKEKQ